MPEVTPNTYCHLMANNAPPEHPRLLTVEQLSDLLQVPVGTIYQWRHRSYGPPGLRVGRYVRYRAEDVDRWLEGLEAGQAA
jgi:excisionase family DNA binding protein